MGKTKQSFGVGHFVRAVLLGGAALTVTGTTTAATGIVASGDKFPRLGLVSTAGAQKYASSFQTFAAKFHVVIINGCYEGWEKGAGYSKEKVISSIKSQSFVGTRVFQYVNLNEVYSTASSNGLTAWYNQVNTKKWWLYPTGTGGTPVADPQSPQKWLVDMAPNVPVDPTTGLGVYAWGAKYLNDLFHLGHYPGTSASVSLDGFFLDNVLVDPSNGMGNTANGDWVRIGTTQAHNAATTYNAVMLGEKEFYTYLSTAWPGSQQLGNAGGNFALADASYYATTDPTLNSQIVAATSPLSGAIHGGVLEHVIGKTFSIEYYGGSAKLQQWYRTALANFGGPKLMILSHANVQPNGSDPLIFNSSGQPVTYSPAWQGVRYGLAAVLMNNGYYSADYGAYDEETVANHRWFDEFDNAGRGEGYLGYPLATAAGNPQTAAWSNGVWMREFQYGVVLWNPKGNGARTVNVSGLVSPNGHAGLKHLLGTQNPGLNNGSAVTSVTLQDRDGLILLWTAP
jgi:hypothetical protein